VITSQPASLTAHYAIVSLGFEGTVLKRPASTYRAGRLREARIAPLLLPGLTPLPAAGRFDHSA
jgi:hypothetical protein